MKLLKLSFILVLTCLFVLPSSYSCRRKARAVVKTVKPYQDMPGDAYCTYTVTASRGGGAIPVGGTVCLYCTPMTTTTCPGTITISPADGVEYDLAGVGSCVSCPNTNTYK